MPDNELERLEFTVGADTSEMQTLASRTRAALNAAQSVIQGFQRRTQAIFNQIGTSTNAGVSEAVKAQQAQLKAIQDTIASTQSSIANVTSQLSSAQNRMADALVAARGSMPDQTNLKSPANFTKGNAEQFKQFLEASKYVDTLKQTLDELTGSLDKDTQKAAALEAQIASLGQTSSKTSGTASNFAHKIAAGIKNTTSSIGGMLKGNNALTKLGANMRSAGNSAGFLKKMAAPAANALSGVWSALRRFFVIGMIVKGVKSLVSATLEMAKTNTQFRASLSAIQGNLQTAFAPIYNAILPALNALMSSLATATNYIAGFVAALFGTTYKAAQQSAQGMNAASKAADKEGKAIAGAAKQAKLASASFDEFNDITNEMDVGGGGGGGVGSIDPAEITPNFDQSFTMPPWMQNLLDWFERVKEAAQPTIAAFNALVAALEPLKAFAFQSLVDFYEHFLKPVGLWVLGEGLPRFLQITKQLVEEINWGTLQAALKGLWDALAPFTTNIGTGLLNFYESVLKPITVWTLGTGLPEFLNIMTKLVNSIDWPKIHNALNKLWAAFTPFAIKVGEGLLWFLDNVVSPLAKWAMNDLIPVALDAVSGALDFLNAALDALKPLGTWLWDNFLKPLAEWTGGLIVETLKAIGDGFAGMTEWIKENQEAFEDLPNKIEGAVEWIKQIFTAEFWTGIWGSMSSTFQSKIDDINAGIKGFEKSVSDKMGEIGKGIQDKWDEAWKAVEDVAVAFYLWWDSHVTAWWNNSVTPWFTKEKWEGVGKGIQDGLSSAWNAFTTWFIDNRPVWWDEHVAPWFTKEKWSGIATGIKTGVMEAWNDFTTGWGTAIASWWDTNVASWFSVEKWKQMGLDAVNSIIGIFNDMIARLNEKGTFSSKGFTVGFPDWMGGPQTFGSGTYTLWNLPTIPTFAGGGMTSGDLFMGNDGGMPELIGTVGHSSGAMTGPQLVTAMSQGAYDGTLAAYGEIAASNYNDNTGGNQNGPKELVLELDSVVLGRVLFDTLDREQRRSGRVRLLPT